MKLSDYSHSLKHAYAKTFSHNTYHSSWNKVSLKDIGIRQPVVHFDLNDHYGDLTGGGPSMSSLSSVRKLSEELARKHISDIDEVDEAPAFFGPGKWTWDRKMSSGSVLSDSSRKSSLDEHRKKKSSDGSLHQYLDYLGERRRSSDASVVLTEDTDSFIIGERVWVGGTKPGQIAYIGETQFAPGEWAGVVLDDFIGKNDGSVANIRYFQCEPKKGVFSRLTRLTRYPIMEAPSPEPKAPSPAPSMEHRRSTSSLTATPPKKSSLTLTSTPKTSISKPSSPDSALHPNIHVGDRVIVMSAQGSKAGVLRFMGPTDFAPGEWCGVELDDPLGKNDGSVAGTRYFECAPRFGLFAPVHKVTKSPVNRKPSQNCQIHRRGSKESLVSIGSTATSIRSTAPKKVAARVPTTPTSTKNAMQDLLKDKNQHIEQLLRERELERAEVTRAATQADEAERKLLAATREWEQEKREMESRLRVAVSLAESLKLTNDSVTAELGEERRRYEDLLFRFEEESIEKSTLESSNESNAAKIRELEKTVELEKSRAAETEQDKIFELDEQLVITREEVTQLTEQLTNLKKTNAELVSQAITLNTQLAATNAKMESLKSDLTLTKSAASQDESKIRETLVQTQSLLQEAQTRLLSETKDLNDCLEREERYKKAASDLENTAKGLDEELVASKSELQNLIHNLTTEKEASRSLEERLLKELALERQTAREIENTLRASLDEERRTIEVKMAEALAQEKSAAGSLKEKLKMQLTEEISKTNEMKCKFEEELSSERKKVEEKLKEFDVLIQEERGKCKRTIVDMEERLEETKKLLHEHQDQLLIASAGADKQVAAMGDIVNKLKADIQALTSREAETICQVEEYKKIVGELEKNLSEKTQNEEALQQEKIESGLKHERELLALKEQIGLVTVEVAAKVSEIKLVSTQNEELSKKLEAESVTKVKLAEALDGAKLSIGDLSRQLIASEELVRGLKEQKSKAEADLESYMASSIDSNAQLRVKHDEVQQKEKEVEQLRGDLSENKQQCQRLEQELQQVREKAVASDQTLREQLKELRAQSTREVDELKEKLSLSMEQAKESISAIRENNAEEVRTREQFYNSRLQELTKAAEKEKINIENSLNSEKNILVKQLDDLKYLFEDEKTKIASENADLKERLDAKAQELVTMNRDLTSKCDAHKAEARTQVSSLEEKLNQERERCGQLERKLTEKEKLHEELSAIRNNLQVICKKQEETIADYANKRQQLESDVMDLTTQEKILSEDKERLKDHLKQREEEVQSLSRKVEELISSKDKSSADMEEKIISLEKNLASITDVLNKTKVEGENALAAVKLELEKVLKESSQLLEEKHLDVKTIGNKLSEVQYLLEEKEKLCERLERNGKVASEELDAERKKTAELGERLNVSDTERVDLKERLEGLQRDVKIVKGLEPELVAAKKTTEELSAACSNLKLEREALDKMLETSNLLLAQKEKEAAALATQVETLTKDKSNREDLEELLQNINILLDQREAEISALQSEVAGIRSERDSVLLSSNTLLSQREAENKALKNEMEVLKKGNLNNNESATNVNGQGNSREVPVENQIDFLNSVIVDMQMKNESLKAKIQAMELGVSPEEIDEYNLNNITARSVAPRLFCDICDCFDLHDTEDCPTQAMDPDEPPPRPAGRPKQKAPPPRPYCDNCEVFGHEAADCDDGETF